MAGVQLSAVGCRLSAVGCRLLVRRKLHAEDASASELALDLDRAALELHDVLDDGEAEAGSRPRLRTGPVDLIEALEDAVLLRPRNARTLIGDRENRGSNRRHRAESDDASVRGKLDRVVDEIAND